MIKARVVKKLDIRKMKKTRSIGMILAILCMAIAGSSAMAGIAADSADWEGGHEMDTKIDLCSRGNSR